MLNSAIRYMKANTGRFIKDLQRLASQPSVSAKGEGIEACARLVREMMEDAGVRSRILRLPRANPVVYGELRSKRNPSKTVLFYNHYDVQPPEPLELWDSEPFRPIVKGGKVFGRGVSDDKGEVISRLKLTESFLKTAGDVPCNFKFLIEGEEEIGSVNLHRYVSRYRNLFRADGVVWEFGSVDEKGRPIVVLGVKGILYVELTAREAKRDAHSSLAAVVRNPAWRLAWALSTLKDGEDRILVPHWYDDVRAFTRLEVDALRRMRFEEKALMKELGIRSFIHNLRGLELKKALAGKPTCTICGLKSGYQGPGSKTVLPAEAKAKIDFRLVPDQKPERLLRLLRNHLSAGGFGDIEVQPLGLEPAARTPLNSPIARFAAEAAKETYHRPPVISVSSAGTGPMYLFIDDLRAPCVAIGGGHSKSRAHSPNENLRIDLFKKGMVWVSRTVAKFAAY